MKRPELFNNGEIFIKAMEELIKRYQKAKNLGISKDEYERDNWLSCLLCEPSDKIGYQKTKRKHGLCLHSEICSKFGCPWMVILGITCDDFPRNNKLTVYHNPSVDVINRRIKQIRNWIKIYKKHMEM